MSGMINMAISNGARLILKQNKAAKMPLWGLSITNMEYNNNTFIGLDDLMLNKLYICFSPMWKIMMFCHFDVTDQCWHMWAV